MGFSSLLLEPLTGLTEAEYYGTGKIPLDITLLGRRSVGIYKVTPILGR